MRLLSLLFLLLVATVTTGQESSTESTASSDVDSSIPADETIPPKEEHYDCQGRLALVTGATGRVGSLVVADLLSQGFCVRVFSRSAEKIEEKLGSLLDSYSDRIESVVGTLGDGVSVARAFQSSSSKVPISHVVFAAGGEDADFDAVNHKGVAECALAAAKQSPANTTLVIISAAWVSKPYSLASLLFNNLYPNVPMARHLQGEDALRTMAHEHPNLNYVILRAGRLVPDEEYQGPKGLLYEQGDSFFFWGPAGQPGMCHTQLAKAVVTAMTVEGRYTVEVTSGTTDIDDASVYQKFQPDDRGAVQVNAQDVVRYHTNAAYDILLAVLTLLVFQTFWMVCFTSSSGFLGVLQKLFVFVIGWILFVGLWTVLLSDWSVLDIAGKATSDSEL